MKQQTLNMKQSKTSNIDIKPNFCTKLYETSNNIQTLDVCLVLVMA